jgi:ABC-2 type transport system permease protein
MNNMLNVIKRKLKEQFRTGIYYALGLFTYAWMIIAIFPLFSGEEMLMEDYLSVMPEEMLALLGVEDITAMSTIEGFLSLEYLTVFFVLILAFFVSSSAGSTVAGAIEKKTIDFQLSQPISRARLLISEAFVTVTYAIGLVIFNSVAMIVLSKLHNVDLSTKGVLAFTVLASGLMLSIYGISIFLSSFLKSKTVVMTTTIFLIMAMHIFQSLTTFVDKLKDFESVTLFYMYKPETILKTAQLDLNHILIFLLIFAVGLVSSIIIFQRKDIA